MLKKIGKKKIIKVLIAAVLAIVSLYGLYNAVVPKDKVNIKYGKYIRAVSKIDVDQRIEENMIAEDIMPIDNISPGAITEKAEIIGKYAASDIYPDELIRKERIKKEKDSEYQGEERRVRIYTNLMAYGGVGPGDRADLVYTGENVGVIKYEGVLVEKVLNEDGVELSNIKEDKFNKESRRPYIIELKTSQEMALNIATLQGNENEVKFKLIKWTERSLEQDTEGKILNLDEALGIDRDKKETPVKVRKGGQ